MTALSLSADRALALWTALAVLVVLARLLGALARRFGQPDIVGSLLAGLLLGPSVLGQFWPAGERLLLPDAEGGRLLGAVAGFALLVLLVVLGAETDLGLIRRLGAAAGWVTGGSIAVPLAGCLAVAYVLAPGVLPAGGEKFVGALLLGGALSVSSLPVVARTILELGMARRNFGQLAFAAATLNDVYGFLLLVVGAVLLNPGGLGQLLRPTLGLLAVVAALAVAGQPMVDALLRRVRAGGPNVPGSLTVSFGFAFGLAAVTQSLDVDAALGAFLAGVVLGRSRFQQGEAMRHLEHVTAAWFAPLYFATAGLQVDLTSLSHGPALVGLGALFATALVSKYAGARLGARLARLPRREGAALAVALNGRGAMQVIIGTAGLRLGVLSEAAYTILLLISIVSSVGVAPLLRRIVGSWPGTTAERERLEHEERLRTNVLVRDQRLLLPTRGGPNSLTAALLMDRAWPPEAELTLLSIGGEGAGDEDGGPVRLPGLSGRKVRHLRAAGDDVLAAVLAEANLGYGVIGLGTVEEPDPAHLLPEMVAELLNRSPLPLLVVRRARQETGAPPREFRRVLVPVTGTAASRAAEEIGRSFAARASAQVDLLHVVTRREPEPARHRRFATSIVGGAPSTSASATASAVLGEAREAAGGQGVAVRTARRFGSSPGEEIVAHAEEVGADLVLVGSRVRRVGGRPFLGHTVEQVLDHAVHATVAVVVVPDAASAGDSEPYADRQAR